MLLDASLASQVVHTSCKTADISYNPKLGFKRLKIPKNPFFLRRGPVAARVGGSLKAPRGARGKNDAGLLLDHRGSRSLGPATSAWREGPGPNIIFFLIFFLFDFRFLPGFDPVQSRSYFFDRIAPNWDKTCKTK
jgi:hypothetical protein